ncbi:glycosyltransferase family protein [Kineococcus sp. SYSU DK005]|uniref:hypothetical protein n=1 Tax=Kineococcus sp. SYSU DK005 TaxID=3383126 RepID=UPI003D7C9359
MSTTSPASAPSPTGAPGTAPADADARVRCHLVGTVQPAACGVRDYGTLLARELRRRGLQVQEEWLPDDGRSARRTWRTALDLLARARSIPAGDVVLWQYASYNYAAHGVPMPGVLFGLLCRARGVRVVTVLHELSATWERRGAGRAVQALSQRAALLLVLAGTDVPVVTTDQRVGQLRRTTGRRARMVPVFSNVPVVAAGAGEAAGEAPAFTVGVFSWSGDLVDPDLLLRAVARLPGDGNRVLLLGAPGPGTAAAERWLQAARAAGVAGCVEFSGVVELEDLSVRLQECDVLVQLDSRGASSRRGTVAAALAHGKPLVTLTGADTWGALSDSSAVVEVTADPADLARALTALRQDPELRAGLGRRARAFYEATMSLPSAAAFFESLLRRRA